MAKNKITSSNNNRSKTPTRSTGIPLPATPTNEKETTKPPRRPSFAERIRVRRFSIGSSHASNSTEPTTIITDEKLDERTGNAVTPEGPEPLSIWQACRVGDEATVRSILDTNPAIIHWMEPPKDDSATDRRYHTPLYYACRNGHTTIVQLLIAAGAQLDGSEILEMAQSYNYQQRQEQEQDKKTKSSESKKSKSMTRSTSTDDLKTSSPLVRTPSHVMIVSTLQKALKAGPKRRKVRPLDSPAPKSKTIQHSRDAGYSIDPTRERNGYTADNGDDDDVGLNKFEPSDTTASILAALEQQQQHAIAEPVSEAVLTSSSIPLERKLSYLERLFHPHRRSTATDKTKKKKKKKMKKTKKAINEDGTPKFTKNRKKSATTKKKNNKITVGTDVATIETDATKVLPTISPKNPNPVPEPANTSPSVPSLLSWFISPPPPSSASSTPNETINIKQAATIVPPESITETDTGCGCNLYSDTKELLIPSNTTEHDVPDVPVVENHDHATKKVNFAIGAVDETIPSDSDQGTGPMVEEIGTEVKLSDGNYNLQLNSGSTHHTITTIILDEGNNTSHKVTPKRSNIVATPRFSSFFPISTSSGTNSRSTSPTTVKPDIPTTSTESNNTERETTNKTIPTASPTRTEELTLTAATIAAATSTAMYPTTDKSAACDVSMVGTSDSDSDSMVLEDDEDYDGSEYDDDDSSVEYDSDGSYYSDDDDDDEDDDSDVQDDEEEEDVLITKGPQAGEGTTTEPPSLPRTRSKPKSIKKNVDDDDVDDPSKDVIKILYDAPSIIDDVKAEFCCMFIPIDDCSCFPTN